MLERFTKAAREVVERTQQIAIESRASQVRPEHLFAALLWDDQLPRRTRAERAGRHARSGCTPSSTGGARATSTGSTTRTPRRWPASASTSRRSSGGSATSPSCASGRASRGCPAVSRDPRRRCSSWPCARRSRCGTTTSAPSTSCSGWCARATSSSGTPWPTPGSTPAPCAQAVAEAVAQGRLSASALAGHEVDQLLDPAEQRRGRGPGSRARRRGCASRRGRCRPGRGAASRTAGRRPSSTRRCAAPAATPSCRAAAA